MNPTNIKRHYYRADPAIWAGRIVSNEALYFHQVVDFVDINDVTDSMKDSICIIGYRCDEGIRRNKGRVGAAEGPPAIRSMLGRLVIPNDGKQQILDVGDVICPNRKLEDTQDALSYIVSACLKKNCFPIVLGGGHDVAYGHYKGIADQYQNSKIGIINLDAHFDLRIDHDGSNSGTPFYQIATHCRDVNIPFQYFCLGIQSHVNNKLLFETADKLGVQYIMAEECTQASIPHLLIELEKFIAHNDVIYLTIDLDVFASAHAPGVSAPGPFGIDPLFAREILKFLIQSEKLKSMDIAEMNPKFDLDNNTARLAAGLIHFMVASFNAD